jgi:SAM-dependent methyltransferase
MQRHFDKHLNLKDLIRDHQPKTILELGANKGENTINLIYLAEELGYKLIVISPEYPTWTQELPGGEIEIKRAVFEHRQLDWVYGVSYIELPKMADDSIDFCIVDTDHNYWTLEKELLELKRVMAKDGIVAIHDTEEFAARNGTMNFGYFSTIDSIESSYIENANVLRIKEAKTTSIGVDYPLEEILAEPRPYTQAIKDIVPDWEVVAETKESNGAMALRKVS